MTKFEEVCFLSCEKWVESLPKDIPKHKFSKQHNKKMKELLNIEKQVKFYKMSNSTVKFLFVAALLLALTTTVFAIPASREFIIDKFFNHSRYTISDNDFSQVNSLNLKYIPDGFVLVEEYNNEYACSLSYKKADYYFLVDKYPLNTNINFDTEEYDCENININNQQGVYFVVDESEKGLIFNNASYIYLLTGNITKEELVKIAQELE